MVTLPTERRSFGQERATQMTEKQESQTQKEMAAKISRVIHLAKAAVALQITCPQPLDTREAVAVFSDIYAVETFAHRANDAFNVSDGE